MLRNNNELDVKIKCIEQNKPQSKIAEEIGTSAPYVSRIVNSGDKVLNKTFVQIMESLGYDVEFNYVKREEKGWRSQNFRKWRTHLKKI